MDLMDLYLAQALSSLTLLKLVAGLWQEFQVNITSQKCIKLLLLAQMDSLILKFKKHFMTYNQYFSKNAMSRVWKK
jgi:hypothetical protein